VHSFASAHASHFGFAEVSYSEKTNTVQATISLSTEDLERSLAKKNNGFKARLSSIESNKILQLQLSDEILADFSLKMGSTDCDFELIGMEVTNQGITHFYYESQKILFHNTVSVLFNNLARDFPEQQNKLTFIFMEFKQTLIFTTPQLQTFNID